jgi:hypothetical protein
MFSVEHPGMDRGADRDTQHRGGYQRREGSAEGSAAMPFVWLGDAP